MALMVTSILTVSFVSLTATVTLYVSSTVSATPDFVRSWPV